MSYSTLDRAFFLSKVLGCFPFSVHRGGIRISYKLLASCLLVKLVFAPQPLLNIFGGTFFATSKTKLHVITAFGSLLLAFIVSTLAFAFYFYNNKSLELVVRNYSLADVGFIDLGYEPCTKMSVYLDYSLIGMALCSITWRAYLSARFSLIIAYQFVYIMHVMTSMFMMVQPFVRLIENLTARVKNAKAIVYQECKSGRKSEKRLTSALQLYDLLCCTGETLNDIYGQNLLFIFAHAFFMITTYAYYVMTNALTTEKVITHGLASLYYTVILYMAVNGVDRLSEQARDFNILLFQMMIDDKTGELVNNNKLSLHISMKRKLDFTLGGLTPLNYSLVNSMIGAGTTYLALLFDYSE